MENCTDFLNYLGPDISFIVLTYLDDPTDLLRMASVSCFWRQFVIVNGFCKKLCIRIFPEVLRFTSVIEERNSKKPIEVISRTSVEWESLERDHRVYAHLARSVMSPRSKGGCIRKAISASSTDNYPEESIEHTLEPKDEVKWRPSYWSSEGKDDPEVPETLTYMLQSKLCLVTEINIQPFKAYFQYRHPIYSARAVRFRMGHAKSPLDMGSHMMVDSSEGQISYDENYIWTYISPEFRMTQESCLQTFKLPQPVICIGGILQIELLGRIQRQEMDGLYYIWLVVVETCSFVQLKYKKVTVFLKEQHSVVIPDTLHAIQKPVFGSGGRVTVHSAKGFGECQKLELHHARCGSVASLFLVTNSHPIPAPGELLWG